MKGSYRLDPATSTLRLYATADNSREAHTAALMTVQHITPGIWALSALRGELCRTSMRAMMDALLQHGVRTVIADRIEGHTLPGAVLRADGKGYEIDVQALAKRARHGRH